jgi:hypothetical protein
VCLVVEWNLLCGIMWGVVCICNCVFGCRLEYEVWDILGVVRICNCVFGCRGELLVWDIVSCSFCMYLCVRL